MIKIVGICKPFEMKQRIFVYDNGNKLDAEDVNLTDIHNTIFKFIEKYNCNDIEFIGPKSYTKGIGKKLTENAISKYGENKLKITLL